MVVNCWKENRLLRYMTNSKLTRLLAFFILILAANATAQEINITSYVDKTKVGVNDNFQLTVEVSGENISRVSDVQLPDLEGFRVVGTSSSRSSSHSISGGRMTSTVTRSNIYTLRPERSGYFLIPPISVQSRGETYATEPIRIEVVEGSTEPPPPVSEQFRQPDPEGERLEDNIFIVAEVPKTKVFRGEPLVVRYKIYSRYDLSNLSFVSEPNFEGFWKDDIFFADRMNFRRETYQGRMFNAMLLREIALYPSRSGTLTIPPFSIRADIILRRRSFWDFDSTRRVNINSKPIDIEVMSLPTADVPDSFTGAVGRFNVDATISETDVKVGDPITITLNISGSGNFQHFDPPQLADLPFLRILSPEIKVESSVSNNSVTGTKTISYPVIITQEGSLEIPAVHFSAFDTQREEFYTVASQPFVLEAEAVGQPTLFAGRRSQQDVVIEGQDIFYIRRQANLKSFKPVINNWTFNLLWLLTIATLPIAFIYGKEREKMIKDTAHLRQKLARKILRKYLKLATIGAKNGDMAFYVNAANGLSNYLTDTLKIPRGSTNEEIFENMRSSGYPVEYLERTRKIINKCLEARFKPGGFDKNRINEDYQELTAVISALSNYKNGKQRG